jgi:hypothetical protein
MPTLAATLRWGTAPSVLGAETLKRALDPGNPARDALVGGCLAVGLVPAMLRRLDWRQRQQGTGTEVCGRAAVAGLTTACREERIGCTESLVAAEAICHSALCRRSWASFAPRCPYRARTCPQEERDEAVQRVLFVDVLQLLGLEGGAHSARVAALLGESGALALPPVNPLPCTCVFGAASWGWLDLQRVLCRNLPDLVSGKYCTVGDRPSHGLTYLYKRCCAEVWQAYRGQRHDLFLPAGGSAAQGVVALLRGPEASRFALPPSVEPAQHSEPVAAPSQQQQQQQSEGGDPAPVAPG